MPIELWWWVEPLFYTGLLTLFVVGVPSIWLADAMPRSRLPELLMVLAIAPLVVCFGIVIVWLLTNALIVIWR